MTRDEVIRLAREADIEFQAHTGTLGRLNVTTCGSQPVERIERFAHLVIADFLQRTGQYVTNDASREAALEQAKAEDREACLRCYSPDDTETDWADRIRARGQK